MRSRARSVIAALASALAVGAGAISAPHAWTQPVTEVVGAGQGDQCASSTPLAQLIHFEPPVNLIFEYDVVALYSLLSRGMAASYPQVRPVLDAELNDTGKAILRDSESKCAMPVGMAQNHPHTAQWTSSGQALTAVIDRNPVLRAAFAEQRVGSLTPSAPVLIASAKNDEGALFPPTHATAADWCGGGAAVQLEANSSIPPMTGLAGTHVLAFFPALDASQQWITDRLAGRPAPSNCGALP
ncbi:lipase family protein [Nocardia cyriacigeorgica]|uniref:Secretory lipase n=1 Tax=Nocardia cyriacigeorgica TaxID=135487 RepID=A0A4U8W6F4_9NOCA|nr:lipase family protein [Nocardia cyriacigeorgica]VFB01737.1 Secretory lipase [Nocardia cyriacigeorgica]